VRLGGLFSENPRKQLDAKELTNLQITLHVNDFKMISGMAL